MKSMDILEALTDMDDEVLLRAETESSIPQTSQNRFFSLRWLPKVAVIAAVIMALTVTAFAADAVFNNGVLFSVFFGAELSEDETALMKEIGKPMGASVTRDGATITAIQAIADESFLWVHLKVEAPEGVVLPDLDEEDLYYYYLAGNYLNAFGVQHKYSSDQSWTNVAYGHSVEPLEDADPNDNVKEFVVVVHGEKKNSFRRTGKTRLIIPGLYIHKGRDSYLNTLFTGRFVFDISMNNVEQNNIKTTIDTNGVTFHNDEYGYTTTVESVTISPLHIDVDFKATQPNDPYIFPYGGPVELVMKDGTRIQALDAWFDARNQIVADPNDVAGPKITYFTTPVVVENIDYIIVGREYTFDVN